MSYPSDHSDKFESTRTVEVEETSSSDYQSRIEILEGDTSRSYAETIAFKELKEQYDGTVEKCSKLSIKLASVEAQLVNVNVEGFKRQIDVLNGQIKSLNGEIENIGKVKNDTYVELKKAQADAEFQREAHDNKSRRVKQLEEQISQMMSDHRLFKETIFDLLGLDKSKMTKTTTKDLINFVRSVGPGGPRPDKEIADLKAQIVRLEAKLAAAPIGPSPVNQSLLDAMEERHKLSKQVQEEQHKYSTLVHEVRIFKTEADEESRRLSVQLEAAYTELEQIQTSLKEVVSLSGFALTSSTAAFAKVDVIRDHKCKHATSIFESYEETSHSSHRQSTASFEHSGSERHSSSSGSGA